MRFPLGQIHELTSGKFWNSAELSTLVEERRAHFLSLGLSAGGGVLIQHHNTAAALADLLAAWDLEACAIPIDPKTPALSKIESALGVEVVCTAAGEARRGHTPKHVFPEGSRLGLVTSGTTAAPRIVVHGEKQIRSKVQHLSAAIPAQEVSRTFCALPTYFGHGLICNSLFPLLKGQTVFLADSFSPAVLMNLDTWIEEFEITFLSTTPSIWSLISEFSASQPKPTLRRIHCASAPMDERRVRQMRTWCPSAQLWNVYGMTEFLGWISGVNIHNDTDAGSVGTGWGVQLQIDPLNREIYAQGPTLMTAWSELKSSVDWQFPTQNWPTRDRGEWGADGSLRLLGRLDFIINKGGFKVQPEEVEAAVAGFADVSASACLPAADEIWGQKIVLLIVAKNSSTLRPAELRVWLAARLIPYKMPDVIRVVGEIPVNSRGKIDRARLASEHVDLE